LPRFRYKKDLDPNGIPQFGLVAEQVEKVNPDLVARDDQGKPYTVRYEAVNAMLLNEFLKEHRKVEKLEATVAHIKSAETQQKDLQATVAQQQQQIERVTRILKEQASQIQKVSDALKTREPTPQMVANTLQ
jgi:predicted RNase H-like nuclease (RuvC/YqgF family)